MYGKVTKKKKYLGTIFSSHLSLEDGQQLSQRQLGKANSNINDPRFHFTYRKTNSQGPYEVETRRSAKSTIKYVK